MESLQKLGAETRLIALRAKKLFTAANIPYTLQELSNNVDSALFSSDQYNTLTAAFASATTAITTLAASAKEIGATYDSASLADKLALVADVTDGIALLMTSIDQIQSTLQSISTADGSAYTNEFKEFAQNLAAYLSEYLLIGHLVAFHPRFFAFSQLLGLIRDRETQPNSTLAVPSNKRRLHLQGLSELFKSPKAYFDSLYGWGTPQFAYRRFLANIDGVLASFSIPLNFLPRLFETEEVPTLHLGAHASITPIAGAVQAFRLDIHNSVVDGSFGLPSGATDWELAVGVAMALSPGIEIIVNWDGSLQATFPAGSPSAAIGIALKASLPTRATPYPLLSTPFGAGLTTRAVVVEVSFTTPALAVGESITGPGTIALVVNFTDLNFSINPNEGDSFINKLLGSNKLSLKSDLSILWSSETGLIVHGGQGLQLKKTLNVNLGSVRIQNLVMGLVADDDAISLVGLLSATAKLGPVQVDAENLGFQANLVYEEGNLGLFDVSLGFKPPVGVGLSVESEAVKGGGYLYFNPSAHQYAGVASLSFRDKLSLNAVGLLQTKLPNNRPGYSLLLLITAEFSPVQLGLGFTLNGVGGLLGVHRAANLPALQTMVRQGRLDTLLFPPNILASPATALATADAAFPATEGRHVFGLLAKLGWGTPKTLITLDLALLVELPAPVRLLLLGSLRATLPNQDSAALRLRADFVGVVDFGTKTASFDAALVDSRLLTYALAGELAFRLQWGESPVFLLSVGGFHPAFQPPAAAHLPALRRLTLALADSRDFQLRFTAYLALTSNTVQFGAGAYLYAAIAGDYYLEGHLSFDTLVQVSPLQLLVLLSAGLAVKRNGKTKLGLALDLGISGPAPWHVQGQATFKIIIEFKVDINRTFGASAPAPALPEVDVATLLQQAFSQAQSWEGVLPAQQPSAGVVVRAQSSADALLLAPHATLQVRQQLLPLGLELQRYGQGRPAGGPARFELQSLTLGAGAAARTLQGAQLQELREPFAPGQYRDLTDAERLSMPSFEPMRSGVRLRPQGYTGGGVVNQALTYSRVILRRQATSARPGDGSADQFAGTPALRQRTSVSATAYQQLARNGALAQALPAPAAATAPPQVGWKQETYAVVRAADLGLHRPGAGRFLNQAEAQAYLQEQVRTDAALTQEDLLVLPAYQLA